MSHFQTKSLIGQGWVDIFTEFGFQAGDQLTIHNPNSQYLFLSSSEDPEDGNWVRLGFQQSATINYTSQYAWVKCEGRVSVAPQISKDISVGYIPVDLPHDIYTGDDPKLRRLRVDQQSTGFYQNREHRTFREFNITAGETWAIRADVTGDIILWDIFLEIVTGNVLFRTVFDDGSVTETTPFSTSIPVLRKNNMDQAPMPDINFVSIMNGGQFTGGIEIDRHRYKVSDNSNFANSVGASVGSERGVSAGTYYLEITAVAGDGDVQGIISSWWESQVFN